MSAIDMIRNVANDGTLTAFDCMRLANSIGFALDDMPESDRQKAAQAAIRHAAFTLMLLAKEGA